MNCLSGFDILWKCKRIIPFRYDMLPQSSRLQDFYIYMCILYISGLHKFLDFWKIYALVIYVCVRTHRYIIWITNMNYKPRL